MTGFIKNNKKYENDREYNSKSETNNHENIDRNKPWFDDCCYKRIIFERHRSINEQRQSYEVEREEDVFKAYYLSFVFI